MKNKFVVAGSLIALLFMSSCLLIMTLTRDPMSGLIAGTLAAVILFSFIAKGLFKK